MNMRNLRILIVVFFCIVAVFFTATYIHERMTTDYNAPYITAETDTLRIPVSATEEDLLVGLTAYDKLDGDVTDTLVVVSKTKFISKGVLRVNYAAFDENKNVGTYSREVTYTDYVSPHFHLTTPLRYASGGSTPDYLEQITAEDCLDGDITSQIKVTTGRSVAISDSVTQQQINLQVTNSAGDSAVLELLMSREDYSSLNQPAPALRDYILYVDAGGRLNLADNVIGVWAGGNVRSFAEAGFDAETDVSFDAGTVRYSVPGTYTVIYRLSREGEELGTARLIVVVED